ncbi:hypothetical protein EYF80_032108 [Liparis tanakae]|uniref:Uncharacterized protein n=1 Tax=Liparis tanakae TaxID=230148 RepID=A0A4Z2GVU5_9TELE|nr:hypothetical protein EYF80_032108 [Liparis tanakae]
MAVVPSAAVAPSLPAEPALATLPASDSTSPWLASGSWGTSSPAEKSKVFDFSVGNWEKVLLLFTMLPGAWYFMLDWDSAFFIAGELEEELNSLLKLQPFVGYLIISVHRTASCSSISLSLYWFLSISTLAISTRVKRFLWAVGTTASISPSNISFSQVNSSTFSIKSLFTTFRAFLEQAGASQCTC